MTPVLSSFIRRTLLDLKLFLPLAMAGLTRPNDIIYINHGIYTTKTKARLWDMGEPGPQDKVLDDAGLRAKLATLDSFWTSGRQGKFALIMLHGDPSAEYRPLEIERNTLQYLIKVAGFDEETTMCFFTSRLPSFSFYLQYSDKTKDKPEFMIVLFRFPRNSKYLMGCVRFEFSTRNCLAFMSGVVPEDMDGVWARCQAHTDLLRVHPLYLLAFVYEQRYYRWADWAATLWNRVAEIETATNMTSPTWKLQIETDRLRSLSTSSTLLNQLHATNVELNHSDTVMTFGLRVGKSCLEVVAEAEKRRQDLGLSHLPVCYMSALEARLKYTLSQSESLSDKLSELKNRLVGQIDVSYNLIAQRNSLVNLAVAQQQAKDSRTVKAIAILTLVCLPSTLVATLWTAGLFHIEGDRNWQMYIVATLALTLAVLLCWRVYVLVSEGRNKTRTPITLSVHDFEA